MMIVPKTDLDATDRRIVAALQDDARLSNVELAERVGLSPSPCLRRVKRLEQDGYIHGYRGLLDARKLGFFAAEITNLSGFDGASGTLKTREEQHHMRFQSIAAFMRKGDRCNTEIAVAQKIDAIKTAIGNGDLVL